MKRNRGFVIKEAKVARRDNNLYSSLILLIAVAAVVGFLEYIGAERSLGILALIFLNVFAILIYIVTIYLTFLLSKVEQKGKTVFRIIAGISLVLRLIILVSLFSPY